MNVGELIINKNMQEWCLCMCRYYICGSGDRGSLQGAWIAQWRKAQKEKEFEIN